MLIAAMEEDHPPYILPLEEIGPLPTKLVASNRKDSKGVTHERSTSRRLRYSIRSDGGRQADRDGCRRRSRSFPARARLCAGNQKERANARDRGGQRTDNHRSVKAADQGRAAAYQYRAE